MAMGVGRGVGVWAPIIHKKILGGCSPHSHGTHDDGQRKLREVI